MSVENTLPAQDFAGATLGVPLPVNFPVMAIGDIYIAKLLVGGTDFINLTPGTDFTRTDLGGDVYEVTTTATYTSDIVIRVFRITAPTQPYVFSEGGPLPAEEIGAMGDRQCMISQETRLLAGIDGFSMTMPPGSTVFLPTAVFADSTARGLTAPVQIDQLGVQHDTGALYRGSSLAAGGWTLIPTSAGTTYSAGNGLTLTTTTFSINTAITADLATAQALTNKSVNGVTLDGSGSASLFLNKAGGYTAPASSGVQTSDSPTWTGHHIFSVNGAASSPAMIFTGSPFAGTTGNSLPLVFLQQTGATTPVFDSSGTFFGINYASGYAGTIFQCWANGTSVFRLTNAGGFFFNQGGSIQGTISITNAGSGFAFVGRGTLVPIGDGNFRFFNEALTSGFRLKIAAADTAQIDKADGSGIGNLIGAMPSSNIAGLPSAATYARCWRFVTDGASNKNMVFSDGAAWRYPDGTTV